MDVLVVQLHRRDGRCIAAFNVLGGARLFRVLRLIRIFKIFRHAYFPKLSTCWILEILRFTTICFFRKWFVFSWVIWSILVSPEINPPAPWGHQAVKDILEASFCNLNALLFHTWCLKSCWNESWDTVNGLLLPPGTGPLPPPMYVPSTQGSLRGTPKNH